MTMLLTLLAVARLRPVLPEHFVRNTDSCGRNAKPAGFFPVTAAMLPPGQRAGKALLMTRRSEFALLGAKTAGIGPLPARKPP